MPEARDLSGIEASVAAAATRFRIATFNLENLGAAAAGVSPEERMRLLRPQLLRLRADVLCLQEVDSQRSAGRERRLAALDTLLEGTPYAAYARTSTRSRNTGRYRDKHNLVILSRFPIEADRQVFHDLVAAPLWRPATPGAAGEAAAPIEWDRPLLYAALRVGEGMRLHVINLHLRAPRAAFLEGAKADAQTWRSMSAWAEGFFVAAMKRAGQALEARLLVDQLFDGEAGACIAVCGDFNAEVFQVPVRTIRGDEEDAGNPHLALRMLISLERSLSHSQRFSVVHHGRPQMVDHVLVSRALLAWYRRIEVHNEGLGDELVTAHAVRGSPESFHAPVVAEFEQPDGAPERQSDAG
jgi:endonuclease/exonuclease/phosphatase family metal-dependent hydrolase